MITYQEFVEQKTIKSQAVGIDVDDRALNSNLFPFQRDLVKLALKCGKFCIWANTGLGKALKNGTRVLTDRGWLNIENIKPGFNVASPDGLMYPVVGVFPQGIRSIYKVTFTDGTTIECDEDHLWYVETRMERSKNKKGNVLTTKKILESGLRYHGGHRFFIPVTKPVVFEEKNLPVDPYLLGVILGDGNITSRRIDITTDTEILNSLQTPAMTSVKITETLSCEYASSGTITVKKAGINHRNPIIEYLDSVGLMGKYSHEKFIPNDYLFSSIEQRWHLLQGLLDTDGCFSIDKPENAGHIEYCTASEHLKDDVIHLVQSLGGTARLCIKKMPKFTHNNEKRYGKTAYRLIIKLPCDLGNPFRLQRKARNYNSGIQRKNPYRAIHSIQKVENYKATCISILSPDNLFLAENFIATHNTAMQLSWADALIKHNAANRVLILAPLGVAKQSVGEGTKFGIPVNYCEDDDDVIDGINITNYEKLHKFDVSVFDAVVLDESSILKAVDGSTRTTIIESFRHTKYKLACSATPSPNDYMELGNQCEFLGVMSYNEMLSMFFTHDGGETSKWVLKPHAEKAFWEFVSSWAITLTMPSDLGYSDDGYILPPLKVFTHKINTHIDPPDGQLVFTDFTSLTGQRHIRKQTLTDRCQEAANIVNNSDEQFLIWCETNDESKLLKSLIPDAVEVKGADSDKRKERSAMDFSTGKIRVMISKPSIFGLGLNFQICHNAIYVGVNHCYSEDTELLTWRGWLRFSEVTTDDLVATVNPDTLEWEWQQPSEVIWNRYEGEMISFLGKGYDLLVTPNHNMFAQKNEDRYKTNTDWRLITAQEMMNTHKKQYYRLRNTPEYFYGKSIDFIQIPKIDSRSPNVNVFNNLAAKDAMMLFGWYLSEGYCCDLNGDHSGQIAISQTDKKMRNRTEIIELIKRIGLTPNHKTKDILFYSKQLATFLVDNFGRLSQNMRIPYWVKDLDVSLLTILRDTILKGDGCHLTNDASRASFLRTTSKQLADDFQEICLKTGIRASIRKRSNVNHLYPDNVVYDVQLAWKNTHPSICTKPTTEHYSGYIGCVTVPNHTLIVRRNGIPCVSGNSFEQWYQSVRRLWRFGQKEQVNVHIVQHGMEGAIAANLKRKEDQAKRMAEGMLKAMRSYSLEQLKGVKRISVDYNPTVEMFVPDWLKSEEH